jgi:hypothetical protein
VDRPVKYGSGSVILGQGEVKSRDGSQYLHCNRREVRSLDIHDYLTTSF